MKSQQGRLNRCSRRAGMCVSQHFTAWSRVTVKSTLHDLSSETAIAGLLVVVKIVVSSAANAYNMYLQDKRRV